MLMPIPSFIKETLSDSTDTTTLFGDYLRNEGIIGYEKKIEDAYQTIALNNLPEEVKAFAAEWDEPITSIQQLLSVMLSEIDMYAKIQHLQDHDGPEIWSASSR